MKQKKISFTVGIPTCYGGETLLETAKSIRASTGIGNFRFLVVADTVPFTPAQRKEFKKLEVEIIWNPKRGSQAKKIEQLLSLTTTDVFIFTQDDVRFLSTTLNELIKVFQDRPEVTMITTRVLPEPAETVFERIIEVGAKISYHVSVSWKSGDNYLSANGRCMGFRMNLAKKFVIHQESINNDAYLYFENKRLGGVYHHEPNAIVYNKSPLYLREHLNQTSRFQYSQAEMAYYFGNVSDEYHVPSSLMFKDLIAEFLQDPLYTMLYLIVNVYAKVAKRQVKVKNPLWTADVSTKRVKTA